MADRHQRDARRHLILAGTSRTERFRQVLPPMERPPIPQRNREAHGRGLLDKIGNLGTSADEAGILQEHAGLDSGFGLRIQFRSFPDVELAFERLAREFSFWFSILQIDWNQLSY